MKNNTKLQETQTQTQAQAQMQAQTQSQEQPEHEHDDERGAEVTTLPVARRYKELFVVEDRPDGRGGYWTKIGAAFETKNGHWSLKLSALPVGTNRIIMIDPRPKDASADHRERAA